MAELSLRERLQPALFDRLIDEERMRTLFEVTVRPPEALAQLGIAARELSGIFAAQGLVPAGDARQDGGPTRAGQTGSAPDVLRMTFTAPAGRVSPAQLRALVLTPPGRPQGVTVESFCEITARTVPNDSPETGERRSVSMRRLREYVCRDLAALLNCSSLDTSVDLSNYPEVRRSVLNYGMPSLVGRTARTVDPLEIARLIETAIAQFEPRLSHLQVTPEMGEEGAETHVLAFRIEAQLWGQPTPQQLVLRTSIDIDSGDVRVADAAGR